MCRPTVVPDLCVQSLVALPPSLPAQELLVHREWDVHKHPRWLVFEAEQGLQARAAAGLGAGPRDLRRR